MAESNSKLSAPLQKFAKDLRETLIRSETAIREMRAREVSTKERKLAKHELCPLCGGPDVNGRCKCIDTLQKNATMGYANDPAQAGGGGGSEPMGMSEALCKKCGKSHGMSKCDMDDVRPGKDLAKKTPEGISEKTMHKLKDEYGHDKEGKSKAYATANAIANGTVNHKSDAMDDMSKSGTTPHLDETKKGADLTKAGMPSSSAGAIAPPKARPPTPVAAVNHELGSFQSLAHSPTAMPGAAGPGLAPGGARKPLAHMGRAGISNSATAGMIPNAKGEKNYGSARSPYGTGGPGHATQTNMPSNLKANMAVTKAEMSKPYASKIGITDHRNKAKAAYGDGPHDQRPAMHQADMGRMNSASFDPPKVKKDELPVVNAEPEKSVKGAKAPKAGKSVDAKQTGAGGQIKKGAALSKAAPALAAKAPAGKGVPGKQPVGQGGGDAHKTAATAKTAAPAKGLPGPGGTKGTNAVTKPVPAGPKPAPAGPNALRRAGSAEVGRMIGDKGAAPVAAPLPSSDVDVSEFDKGPNRLAPFKGAGGQADPTAGMKQMVHPNVMADRQKAGVHPMTGIQGEGLQNVRDDLNLAADKKAGGVGFLRGLMSMFSRAPGKSVQPTGKGMRPAPTASVDQAVRQLGGNNGNITRPTDSTGGVVTTPAGQQGLRSSKRFHGALPLQRGEMDMKKAALSLTKKDLEADDLDKGFATNHSRRMLAVVRKRQGAKKNR